MWTTSGLHGFSRATDTLLQLLEPTTPTDQGLASPQSDLLRSYESLRRKRAEETLAAPAAGPASAALYSVYAQLGAEGANLQLPAHAPAAVPAQQEPRAAQHTGTQAAQPSAPAQRDTRAGTRDASGGGRRPAAQPANKYSLRAAAGATTGATAAPRHTQPTQTQMPSQGAVTGAGPAAHDTARSATQREAVQLQTQTAPARVIAATTQASTSKPASDAKRLVATAPGVPGRPTASAAGASGKAGVKKGAQEDARKKGVKRGKPSPVQLRVTGRAVGTVSPPRQPSPLRLAHRTMQAKISAMQEQQQRLLDSGLALPQGPGAWGITPPAGSARAGVAPLAVPPAPSPRAMLTQVVSGFSSPSAAALQSPSSRQARLQRLKELREATRRPTVGSEASDLAAILRDAELPGSSHAGMATGVHRSPQRHARDTEESWDHGAPDTTHPGDQDAHHHHDTDESTEPHDWDHDSVTDTTDSHPRSARHSMHDTDIDAYSAASHRMTDGSLLTTTTTATTTAHATGYTSMTDSRATTEGGHGYGVYTGEYLGPESSGLTSLPESEAVTASIDRGAGGLGGQGWGRGDEDPSWTQGGARDGDAEVRRSRVRSRRVETHNPHHQRSPGRGADGRGLGTAPMQTTVHAMTQLAAQASPQHTQQHQTRMAGGHMGSPPGLAGHATMTTTYLRPHIIVVRSPPRGVGVSTSAPKVSTAAQTIAQGSGASLGSTGVQGVASGVTQVADRGQGMGIDTGTVELASMQGPGHMVPMSQGHSTQQQVQQQAQQGHTSETQANGDGQTLLTSQAGSAAGQSKRPMVAEMIRRFREEPPLPRSARAALAGSKTAPAAESSPPPQGAHDTASNALMASTARLPAVGTFDTTPQKGQRQGASRELSPGRSSYAASDDDAIGSTEAVAAALLARSRALLKERDAIQQRIQATLNRFTPTNPTHPTTSARQPSSTNVGNDQRPKSVGAVVSSSADGPLRASQQHGLGPAWDAYVPRHGSQAAVTGTAGAAAAHASLAGLQNSTLSADSASGYYAVNQGSLASGSSGGLSGVGVSGVAKGDVAKRPVAQPAVSNQSWRQKLRQLLQQVENPPEFPRPHTANSSAQPHVDSNRPLSPTSTTTTPLPASQLTSIAQLASAAQRPMSPQHAPVGPAVGGDGQGTLVRPATAPANQSLLAYTPAFQRQMAAGASENDAAAAAAAAVTAAVPTSPSSPHLTTAAVQPAVGHTEQPTAAAAMQSPHSPPSPQAAASTQFVPDVLADSGSQLVRQPSQSVVAVGTAGSDDADEDLDRILKKLAAKFGMPDAPSLHALLLSTQQRAATAAATATASQPAASADPAPASHAPDASTNTATADAAAASVAAGAADKQTAAAAGSAEATDAAQPAAAGAAPAGSYSPTACDSATVREDGDAEGEKGEGVSGAGAGQGPLSIGDLTSVLENALHSEGTASDSRSPHESYVFAIWDSPPAAGSSDSPAVGAGAAAAALQRQRQPRTQPPSPEVSSVLMSPTNPALHASLNGNSTLSSPVSPTPLVNDSTQTDTQIDPTQTAQETASPVASAGESALQGGNVSVQQGEQGGGDGNVSPGTHVVSTVRTASPSPSPTHPAGMHPEQRSGSPHAAVRTPTPSPSPTHPASTQPGVHTAGTEPEVHTAVAHEGPHARDTQRDSHTVTSPLAGSPQRGPEDARSSADTDGPETLRDTCLSFCTMLDDAPGPAMQQSELQHEAADVVLASPESGNLSPADPGAWRAIGAGASMGDCVNSEGHSGLHSSPPVAPSDAGLGAAGASVGRRSASPQPDDAPGSARARAPSRSRSPTPPLSPPLLSHSPTGAMLSPLRVRVGPWDCISPRMSVESPKCPLTAANVAQVLAQTVTCALFDDSPRTSSDWQPSPRSPPHNTGPRSPSPPPPHTNTTATVPAPAQTTRADGGADEPVGHLTPVVDADAGTDGASTADATWVPSQTDDHALTDLSSVAMHLPRLNIPQSSHGRVVPLATVTAPAAAAGAGTSGPAAAAARSTKAAAAATSVSPVAHAGCGMTSADAGHTQAGNGSPTTLCRRSVSPTYPDTALGVVDAAHVAVGSPAGSPDRAQAAGAFTGRQSPPAAAPPGGVGSPGSRGPGVGVPTWVVVDTVVSPTPRSPPSCVITEISSSDVSVATDGTDGHHALEGEHTNSSAVACTDLGDMAQAGVGAQAQSEHTDYSSAQEGTETPMSTAAQSSSAVSPNAQSAALAVQSDSVAAAPLAPVAATVSLRSLSAGEHSDTLQAPETAALAIPTAAQGPPSPPDAPKASQPSAPATSTESVPVPAPVQASQSDAAGHSGVCEGDVSNTGDASAVVKPMATGTHTTAPAANVADAPSKAAHSAQATTGNSQVLDVANAPSKAVQATIAQATTGSSLVPNDTGADTKGTTTQGAGDSTAQSAVLARLLQDVQGLAGTTPGRKADAARKVQQALAAAAAAVAELFDGSSSSSESPQPSATTQSSDPQLVHNILPISQPAQAVQGVQGPHVTAVGAPVVGPADPWRGAGQAAVQPAQRAVAAGLAAAGDRQGANAAWPALPSSAQTHTNTSIVQGLISTPSVSTGAPALSGSVPTQGVLMAASPAAATGDTAGAVGGSVGVDPDDELVRLLKAKISGCVVQLREMQEKLS